VKKIITAPSDIENALYNEGVFPVAGVDEVGRGPLAGPVVACAVVLPEGLVIAGVNDSKKVSEKRRIALAEEIKSKALGYAFSIVNAAEIDRLNILQATMQAMVMAVERVCRKIDARPKAVLVDGTTAPPISFETRIVCVPQGDAKSHLIAAASILAKVERDNIMAELHEKFPDYAWDKNKGYGTAAHMAAIREHGLTPAHRRSFCGKFL